LPPVSATAEELEQLVGNLLDNALKFTPPGGSVRLRAGAEAGRLAIEVEDTGPGIPAEAQPHLFESFYRVDPARQRKPGSGAGLGLAIASRTADLLGGNLTVESAPGKGSAFRVQLPLTR
jgi:two-component system OmpR family sensor kinase